MKAIAIIVGIFGLAVSMSARNITVLYYPGVAETADLFFAYSPNGTESAQGNNPTLLIRPNTTVRLQVPDGFRLWYYPGSQGWQYGPASTEYNAGYDFELQVYNPSASIRTGYYLKPAVNLEYPAKLLILVAGMLMASLIINSLRT